MLLTYSIRHGPPPSSAQIQKILDENSSLIQTIQDFQNMGKANESQQHQQALHRNLVYLASFADTSNNMPQLLPVNCKLISFIFSLIFVCFSHHMFCNKAVQ